MNIDPRYRWFDLASREISKEHYTGNLLILATLVYLQKENILEGPETVLS
jgi:hypothetical protein